MTISNHARQRMKERCGFNRKTQDRMARKAFDEGVTHKQTKGRLLWQSQKEIITKCLA